MWKAEELCYCFPHGAVISIDTTGEGMGLLTLSQCQCLDSLIRLLWYHSIRSALHPLPPHPLTFLSSTLLKLQILNIRGKNKFKNWPPCLFWGFKISSQSFFFSLLKKIYIFPCIILYIISVVYLHLLKGAKEKYV